MKDALYLNIYNDIVKDIKEGDIAYNEKLPSKRNCAKKYGVSLITVENAYEQLISEGYVTPIEKKGYFVNRIDVISTSNIKENIEETKIPTYTYDFTRTNTSSNTFPFSTYAKIARSILTNEKMDILNVDSFKGNKELRIAIEQHLKSYLGMDVSYKQIIIGSGSENLYSLLINFFQRDHLYALEDPGYKSILDIYKINDVKYKLIPLDKDGIDIGKLNAYKPKIVHVSTNHHYPSGITMPITRRIELVNYAIHNDAYIIEDDYDVELRLKGKPITPLYSLNKNDRTIYLNTFSITLSPSIRIAYMVLPSSLLKQYEEKMHIYKCNVSSFDQMILTRFIQEGYFERLLNRKKKLYRDIRNTFIETLRQDKIWNDLKIQEADLGLHLLIQYPYHISDIAVEDLANEYDIKIYTLSHFSTNKKNSYTLLVKYTSLDSETVLEYTQALLSLLHKMKKISKK